MNPPEQEGVIKFELQFEQKPLPEALDLSQLIAWRAVFHRLRLIGQDPGRYGGLGFGNISQKFPAHPADSTDALVISGTQTGAGEILRRADFCQISGFSIEHNRICAEGPVKPSSEALTHAAVYHADASIAFVIHAHCPEIWRATRALAIPAIPDSIAYGTPKMAAAVGVLIGASQQRSCGLFSMLGHEDGVISYGKCADEAATRLVTTLARAIALHGTKAADRI